MYFAIKITHKKDVIKITDLLEPAENQKVLSPGTILQKTVTE